ncbi:MAG: methanogenesis marker 16 metalloprotein, partial [Euryarchaeota archaeon]|nr:methanogenesis marker 16 metalloprotein [Euryarchaeota archaeon]
IVYGTAHSIYNEDYGGGFLFKDILSGKDINIETESVEGKTIESTTNIDELSTAKMIGTRMAFKNYTAFLNPTDKPVSSIFHAIEMEGPSNGISVSGCGELNPIQNDPLMRTICMGSRILLNGSPGIVIGHGTRSLKEKPNLMIAADMHKMDPHYLGGFKTAAGPEIFSSIAAAIPVLDDEILKHTYIKNEDIKLPIADIRGRHKVLGFTDYGYVWNNVDERPNYHPERCMDCEVCIVRERCPTGAYRDILNTRKCFGCGMCAYSCPHSTFEMESGSIKFRRDDEIIDVPIICRQSDIKRARELAAELKKRIEEGKFSINKC